jgi:hypothetical protein
VTRRLRPPSLESLFVATVALFGFRLGVQPISDNSTFVHLRTGIDMVHGAGIPRADPYSYTAAGEPWVVQSWLASWTYGWADRIGDAGLVVLEQAVLMALLAWLVVRLARTGTALRTAAAGGIAVGIGSPYWTPRPLLFGLVCLALLVTVVERRWSPWLLLPVVWLWVNTHGSFPLGVAWLALVAAGEAIERRAIPRVALRYGAAFAGGLVLAAVNPLGPRLLVFPFTVGEKREIFKTIVEWHTPDFQRPAGLFALTFVLLALVVLFRARVGWPDLLPAVAFLGLGLLALRNVPAAGVVVAPALGRALAARPRGPVRPAPSLNLAFAGVIALAFVLFAVGPFRGTAIAVEPYPVGAVTAMEDEGLLGDGHRIAQQDVVGCYLILRYGRNARVFIDDRVDMYPVEVSEDYAALLHGDPEALEVLGRHDVDVVLWDRDRPLVTVLRATGDWQQVFGDDDWVVLRRA